jgi:hypothetical protein
MKGIELPINVLVIVSIAVIVLLGLVVLYFIGFNPFSGSITLTSLKNIGCSNFTLSYNCGNSAIKTTTGIILPVNTYGIATLSDLCTQKFGAPTESQCRTVCGCQ